jgi:hypothetical protein
MTTGHSIHRAGDAAWTEIDAEGKFLKKLLTPRQIRLLPPPHHPNFLMN